MPGRELIIGDGDVDTEQIIMARAEKEDAVELARIATLAFMDDNRYKPPGVCMEGPPGHDDPSAHEKWIENRLYYKALIRDRIVAGCCMERRGAAHFLIHGLFVDPGGHNRGWGKEILAHLFKKYPQVQIWSLETPAYATRNHHFYESAGFKRAAMKKFEPELGWAFALYERRVYGRQP